MKPSEPECLGVALPLTLHSILFRNDLLTVMQPLPTTAFHQDDVVLLLCKARSEADLESAPVFTGLLPPAQQPRLQQLQAINDVVVKYCCKQDQLRVYTLLNAASTGDLAVSMLSDSIWRL